MIRTAAPKLRMLAGPNGSGKSTLFQYLRTNFSFPLGYWLNPDEFDRELRRHGRLYLNALGVQFDDAMLADFVRGHGLAKRLTGKLPRVSDGGLVVDLPYQPGYFTSVFCDFLRRLWIKREESFTFETVMSHPNRVEVLREAREAGYRTYLYYVCTNSDRINHGRVVNRVAQGGHDVPTETVSERYRRSLALLPDAVAASTRAYLFDNSGLEHRFIAEYEEGKPVRVDASLPTWFADAMLGRPGRTPPSSRPPAKRGSRRRR